MLFAQLHETESLHAISHVLLDEDFQKAVGFESINASRLSRKNNEMDPSVVATIFLDLANQIRTHNHQSKILMPPKIIDSTTLPLYFAHYKWATFLKTKVGAKLHLRLVFMHAQTRRLELPLISTIANQLEVLVDDKEPCTYLIVAMSMMKGLIERQMMAFSSFPD